MTVSSNAYFVCMLPYAVCSLYGYVRAFDAGGASAAYGQAALTAAAADRLCCCGHVLAVFDLILCGSYRNGVVSCCWCWQLGEQKRASGVIMNGEGSGLCKNNHSSYSAFLAK